MFRVQRKRPSTFQVDSHLYHDNRLHDCQIGDVAGPYFWSGLDQALTSDTIVYKTVAPADGALIGFMTMIYNIIYLRQGHGGRGFDQDKLRTLLEHANIGTR